MKYIFIFSLLLLSGLAQAVVPPAYSGKINPCVAGQFLDIGETQCKPLDKSFGFNSTTFNSPLPAMVQVVSTCTESAFDSALSAITSNGGGTINIDACNITITGTKVIPSNTIIQGSGAGQTTFTQSGTAFTDHMFEFEGTSSTSKQNLIFRDVKIVGIGANAKLVMGFRSDWGINILVERVWFDATSNTSLYLRHTQQATIRYNWSDNPADPFHGFASLDCFYYNSSGVTENTCSGGTANYWTSDIASYSNKSTGAQDAFDWHMKNFEHAGNEHSQNFRGGKMSDASDNMWMHDNKITGSTGQFAMALKMDGCDKLIDTSMQNFNFAFYRNNIVNNATGTDSALKVTWVRDVLLANNIFTGNGNSNTWDHHSSCGGSTGLLVNTIDLCPGGDLTLSNDDNGNSVITSLSGSDPKCDLQNIGSIF